MRRSIASSAARSSFIRRSNASFLRSLREFVVIKKGGGGWLEREECPTARRGGQRERAKMALAGAEKLLDFAQPFDVGC
jgi:hypothetical protein